MKINRHYLILLSAVLLLGSCSHDNAYMEDSLNVKEHLLTAETTDEAEVELPDLSFDHDFTLHDDFAYFDDLERVVEPSECGPTAFDAAVSETINENLDIYGLLYYDTYATINFYMSLVDTSEQFFGAEGEYTQLMNKRVRNLEKFWNMSGEIDVKGQHNSNFENIELMRETLPYITVPGTDIEAFIQDILLINELSTFLIENPFVSFDGFAIQIDNFFGKGQDNIIVISDGIVGVMTKTGIDAGIIWTGILAHEWSHQIQFKNNWTYPIDPTNIAEATRATELEADFTAAYYMTHKRGATYNWKRVEGFFELFFNIGDCSFDSDGHHGTPLQRMEAARKGFELVQSEKKNGHISSTQQVHDAFLDEYDAIIAPEL
ncbi:hypothetical protein OOZ15_18970 [Galbibacter sp. EGI 63066]|uniref:hypothetical protein n=1 Tax=Galbibacter sp. EGI 63066 TaxID=2993559 RepID=UPI002249756F|nr:hypothetical protein [Galbibacter sp. EGI 63066]MCX2682041.1 hypothetical protein [Galbibacter sp. EGI 63066]